MDIAMKAIGYVQTEADSVPHFWDVSQVEGTLVINEEYKDGLKGLAPGKRIFVIFQFHRSPPFGLTQIQQLPRQGNEKRGVFALSTPVRPNPLGLSVVEIIEIKDRYVRVRGLDMVDGTPILDIKPYAGVKENRQCTFLPLSRGRRGLGPG